MIKYDDGTLEIRYKPSNESDRKKLIEQSNIFFESDDSKISLWRYMSVDKFIKIIEESALYFARPFQFEDPFEGDITQKDFQTILEVTGKALNFKPNDKVMSMLIKKMIYRAKREVAISCWNLDDYESAALWKLYASDGIAIKTTPQRLKACFVKNNKNTPIICKVDYLDYDKDCIVNKFFSYFAFKYKRKPFIHEKEVRAIIIENEKSKEECENVKGGINVGIDLKTLIDCIYVSPATSKWFQDYIKSILKKCLLEDIRVEKSNLYESQIY